METVYIAGSYSLLGTALVDQGHFDLIWEFLIVEMHLLRLVVVLGPLFSSSAATPKASRFSLSRREPQEDQDGSVTGFRAPPAELRSRPALFPTPADPQYDWPASSSQINKVCEYIWRFRPVEVAKSKADGCEKRLKFPTRLSIQSETALALTTLTGIQFEFWVCYTRSYDR